MVENDQVEIINSHSCFQVSSDIKANHYADNRLDCSLTLTQLLCIHVTNFTFSSFYLLTIDIIYKSVSSSSLESSSSYSFIVITGVVDTMSPRRNKTATQKSIHKFTTF